jgi:hypothetical protein
MNFFVMPEGATFGAGQGAVSVGDQHCQTVGYAAGVGSDRVWKVYLDGKGEEGEAAEIARNRIGTGPWYNYYGELIAENLAQLHSDANNLNIDTAVTVDGEYLEPSVLRIPPGSRLRGADFTRAGPYFCFAIPE